MILGVESSCDESALALFDPKVGIRGEWVASQIPAHLEYGGVVPEIAVREHVENFFPLLEQALHGNPAIERIAVTAGPGLAGCLAVGIGLAKSLGLLWDVPVLGANHLRGHAFSPFIGLHSANPGVFKDRMSELLPHLGLIVSGGNTLLFRLGEDGRISIVAETLDDAVGEALDKGAKLFGISYPGGAELEKLAKEGNPSSHEFPRAFPERSKMSFSFSGLKTSLRYRLDKMSETEVLKHRNDVCASYQQAAFDQLCTKTAHALDADEYRSLGLSGGVSNNLVLRSRFDELGELHGLPCLVAEPRHTGDNAAMIAFLAQVDPTGLSDCADDLEFSPSLKLVDVA
ncbi:MAG: tRNA (adenosine(37)-N6)-threonylcarbamoyltransferase complex transferase subunit TsaD [Opitutae bacterium]|jgi:N6-L-threonylcarbamoyladenine synthase|nr:tRNA (adenosine(37)-N6)-threonylcarbamoyltransferase complex transferase subunit TsaD [Opitutae bacterium]|tara:strand:+ start:1018 stop:2049 length:1032 start_codon:yes stop_codon:yes gene_type:complete